ncbi:MULTISPECIES: ABC transporter ATP-binding protein [unclassified Actinomyces]|uniref:ABC transporter ATP-binding protein n=1 Tax=unclassified Actinomyces TaxID=2609248 RepID=UPI0013A6F9EA|nr:MULTISPECIES: ABC transporter ATP-binding protein [unclassified Actinomyces]MBW3069817.1 ABC transporter ATP-binding protein [Actinomyces sp. 594]NDR53924.1 ABC transporter ATP-binding protein [Actinomyces sp. 565]
MTQHPLEAASPAARFSSIPIPDGAVPLVSVSGVTKAYRGRPALMDLTLDLPAGRIVGLMGSNGSGKTTLLKILAGLLADYDGQVRVGGHAPGPETKALVAFLPDAEFLASGLKPEQAIAMFSRLFPDFDADRARELVEFFGLPGDRSLKEMSKGMGEKLRVSLVMARRARVYLLDEPISGVDPAARDVILSGVLRGFDPESLMVISTHLIADVEPIVDSVVFLKDGRLLLAGDADDLRQAHGMSLDALFRKEYR